MSFYLSKLFWTLASPTSLLVLAVLGAFVLRGLRPRLAAWLLACAAIFLLALSAGPLGRWSLQPLEDRYPPPHLPDEIAGVIVLGGALDAAASAAAHQPVLNGEAERFVALAALARRYPQARLVFSGGSGDALTPDVREADYVPALLLSLGLDPARVSFERDSRNTWENALYSKRLVQPRAGETWLLVTSAWHLPRAVGCFRAAGWKVLPYPVDYLSMPRDDWPLLDTLHQLNLFSVAAKEWVGLAAYRLLGRSG